MACAGRVLYRILHLGPLAADMFLGLRRAQMRTLYVGLVQAPRSKAHRPYRSPVGASFRRPSTAFPHDSGHFAENATHPYI